MAYRRGIGVEKRHQNFLKLLRLYLYLDILPSLPPNNQRDEDRKEFPGNGHDE
jgi:hypothetical protein